MQYRFKVIHENEDLIYTDWREDSIIHGAVNTGVATPRIAHLMELHQQYPMASIATEFQGVPPDKQYAWVACPFTDQKTSDEFAARMEEAGYKVRRRDGICVGIGGPESRFTAMKQLVHESIGLLASES